MIVDTSAIVAIIASEVRRPVYEAALEASPVIRMSAATYLEVAIVIDRARDPLVESRLDDDPGGRPSASSSRSPNAGAHRS